MAPFFLEAAARAALIAGGTAVMLWAFRITSAAVKHAAWTAVVLAMLTLPIVMAGGLKVSLPILRPAPAATSTGTFDPASVVPDALALPEHETTSPMASASHETARSANWQDVFVGAYAFGTLVLLARLFLGTVQANRLRRRAAMHDGRLTSGRCVTPITVGWFRPALILPPDWPQWPAAKLSAVLTHEAEHARRHDPLVQWVALLNRAVFWFHPLSWWLERQLATLSEEACDAAVIAAGHSPEDYSRYLLDLARSMTREGRRLNVVGVAMPGSGLKQRLRYVFDAVPMTPISRARLVAAAALCVASTVLFAGTTLTPRTSMSIDARSTPGAQTPTGAVPKFDVVSVKPCDPNSLGSGAPTSGGVSISPGRLVENCPTVFNMIQSAYIQFADGRNRDPWLIRHTPIEGGPDWIRHDPYMVEATADGTASQIMLRGPMLRAVLEDRFHLKVRRETRQGPVYDLVVAASGSKLKPAKDGPCVQPDWTVFPMPPLPPDQHRCAIALKRFDANGKEVVGDDRPETSTYTVTWDDEAISLDDLAKEFLILDRPVVNKTGIAGLVNFHLTHHGDRTNPPDRWPNSYADAAAMALKAQLGLELRPSTGLRDSLVIDHVERPTPDEQVGLAASSAAQTPSAQPAKFDVASVKPCGPNGTPGQGSRSGGAGGSNSPGYLFLNCLTLRQLVNMSSGHADDKLNILLRYRLENEFYPVVGGPSWVGTEQYTIEARAGGVLDRNMLTGPMLRALLEDRFELKTHAATKDVPVYLLKLADGGLKIKPIDPESCYELDPAKLPLPPGTLQNRHPCGIMSRMWGPFRMTAAKLGTPPKAGGSSLADELSPLMDRAVLDRTGLDARYDIEFAYTPDDRTPGYYHQTPARNPDIEAILEKKRQPETPEAANGPTIFKALENLGLKLEPVNYPVPYLVIDSAQRPKPNGPAPRSQR